RMKRAPWLLLVLASFAFGVATPLLADDDDGEKPKDGEKGEKKDPADKRQKALAAAYKLFEDKLKESAAAFQKIEPEKGRRIQKAVDASKDAFRDDADAKTTKGITERM